MLELLGFREDPREELRSPGPGGREEGSLELLEPFANSDPEEWKPFEEGPKLGLEPRLRFAKAVGLAELGLVPNSGKEVRAEEWLDGEGS